MPHVGIPWVGCPVKDCGTARCTGCPTRYFWVFSPISVGVCLRVGNGPGLGSVFFRCEIVDWLIDPVTWRGFVSTSSVYSTGQRQPLTAHLCEHKRARLAFDSGHGSAQDKKNYTSQCRCNTGQTLLFHIDEIHLHLSFPMT